MNFITSKENHLFKRWKKLPKEQVLLEGEHLCQSWLSTYGKPKATLISEHAVGKYARYGHQDGQTFILADRLFNQLSSVPSPQGVMYWVDIPIENTQEVLEENALLLDRIQDPGNLGTILRNAAAAGVRLVYLSSGCANPWSDKVLRSAQGAHFVLKILTQQNLSQVIQHKKIPIFATTLSKTAKNLYTFNIPPSCAWLMGNEGSGIEKTLLDLVDDSIFIPQDSCVESLNVGVASALVLFEQRRQSFYSQK
ncbi:TrmH family RNA methyltransferase [Basilea psittacipulmonis]|uniref:tRNA/rRNA methyltransferase SpoU type domain-containing protein n=1 Tax=Basilea psittacipulmonis DSM 24701 TaxID=1072685 RepID=A0A077DCN1_9BURK|nr:RNA methyltransferase [Basilea psittacipulmonis]AIL32645.1 hypothetical protein IX83_04380 [Basilea psittacipulmonis DSM 24701]